MNWTYRIEKKHAATPYHEKTRPFFPFFPTCSPASTNSTSKMPLSFFITSNFISPFHPNLKGLVGLQVLHYRVMDPHHQSISCFPQTNQSTNHKLTLLLSRLYKIVSQNPLYLLDVPLEIRVSQQRSASSLSRSNFKTFTHGYTWVHHGMLIIMCEVAAQ